MSALYLESVEWKNACPSLESNAILTGQQKTPRVSVEMESSWWERGREHMPFYCGLIPRGAMNLLATPNPENLPYTHSGFTHGCIERQRNTRQTDNRMNWRVTQDKQKQHSTQEKLEPTLTHSLQTGMHCLWEQRAGHEKSRHSKLKEGFKRHCLK